MRFYQCFEDANRIIISKHNVNKYQPDNKACIEYRFNVFHIWKIMYIDNKATIVKCFPFHDPTIIFLVFQYLCICQCVWICQIAAFRYVFAWSRTKCQMFCIAGAPTSVKILNVVVIKRFYIIFVVFKL